MVVFRLGRNEKRRGRWKVNKRLQRSGCTRIFWFIFHSVLIMYSAIYVPFMTGEVHIFALKLSFWNMNHTCSIRFDTLIMKRCFLAFLQRHARPIFITIDYSITFTYVCACILYIYSRCIAIYVHVCDTNNCICKHCRLHPYNPEKCWKHNTSFAMMSHVNFYHMK